MTTDGDRRVVLSPRDARLRGLTYESAIHVEVQCRMFDGELFVSERTERELLGTIPVMVRTNRLCNLKGLIDKELAELGECVYDQGGYFVINGSEKVMIAQERQAYNRVYCFRHKKVRSALRAVWFARTLRVCRRQNSCGWRRSGPSRRSPCGSCPRVRS